MTSPRATDSYTLGWAFIKRPVRLNSYWSNTVNLRRYLIIISQRPAGLEISLTLSGVVQARTPIHLSHDYESHDIITPYHDILRRINDSQIPLCPYSHQHVETLLNELHSDVVVIPLRQLRTPFRSPLPNDTSQGESSGMNGCHPIIEKMPTDNKGSVPNTLPLG